MSEPILDLWKKVREHPDYAGGTIFIRDDLAAALKMHRAPEEDWFAGMDDISEEEVGAVTDEEMAASRSITDNYLANSGYSWYEAIADNIDDYPGVTSAR